VLAGRLLKQRQFLNVIKHLGNELQIPIVAAGTQDAFNAIQTDPQLANRFETAGLRRWTMGEDYLRLLASFEVALPLEQRSGARRAGVGAQDPESPGGDHRRDLSAPLPCRARGDRTRHRHLVRRQMRETILGLQSC
jgi:hypothetical protein